MAASFAGANMAVRSAGLRAASSSAAGLVLLLAVAAVVHAAPSPAVFEISGQQSSPAQPSQMFPSSLPAREVDRTATRIEPRVPQRVTPQANEAPNPVDTPGVGKGTVTVDLAEKTLRIAVTFSQLLGTTTIVSAPRPKCRYAC